MSAEEFWKDDPQLFVSYRTSFLNQKKRAIEEEDYKSWLRGLYVHNGNTILLLSLKQFISNILASFSKGTKDNQKLPLYPEKPYFEKEKERKKIEEIKKTKYEEYENSLVYYGTLKQQYEQRLKEKAKKGE